MGACSSPGLPDAAPSSKGSGGPLANSEAFSSGPSAGASAVTSPVIAGLVGGQAAVCRSPQWRVWPLGCLGHLGPGLYSRGGPTPSEMIPSCGVRSGRGDWGVGSS